MVKIYGSYGGLFVFKLLDDYRVCVKKKGIFTDPLLLQRVRRVEVWAGYV
jgi:hypothetical protein